MNVRNPRFPLFDSLRAIAAISVFGYHVGFNTHWLNSWIAELNTGVAVFFVISGFLLYRPLVNARVHGADQPPVIPYAIRRFFRIVPAYWVALVLIALWRGLESDVFSPGGILAYFGFLQVYEPGRVLGGIGVAWSLCIEVSFYVMLPIWAFAMRRVGARASGRSAVLRTEVIGLLVLFAAGVAWKVAFAGSAPSFAHATSVKAYVLPAFLDHFALGMGLAVASVAVATAERPSLDALTARLASWAPWVFALGCFVLLVKAPGFLGRGGTGAYVGDHLLRGLIGAGLVIPAVFGRPNEGPVRWLLARRWLLWLGLVSYAFYLWHGSVMIQLRKEGVADALGDGGYLVVAFAVSVAIAAASYYLVERRALEFGGRLARRAGGGRDRGGEAAAAADVPVAPGGAGTGRLPAS